VIQVLDCQGKVVATLDALVTGPWALTIFETCDTTLVFVSNVITGTVVRINLSYPPNFHTAHYTVIGSGYTTRPDSAAFVVGPAGLAYDPKNDVLFVASEGDNKIFKITQASSRTTSAGTGTLVYADNVHLHGPLGLVFTEEGHLITANADAVNSNANLTSELVEFTTEGKFLAQFSIDPNNGGAFELAFGVIKSNTQKVLAALDDNQNEVQLYSQGPFIRHHDNDRSS